MSESMLSSQTEHPRGSHGLNSGELTQGAKTPWTGYLTVHDACN